MSRCGALDERQTLASLDMCLRSLYIGVNVSQKHQYSLRATLGIARSDMLRYKKSSQSLALVPPAARLCARTHDGFTQPPSCIAASSSSSEDASHSCCAPLLPVRSLASS